MVKFGTGVRFGAGARYGYTPGVDEAPAGAGWVILVETSARRLADGVEFPLYLAKPRTVKFAHACYLGQVAELPRLTRQADSSQEPRRVPVWGELRLVFHPDNRPDAENTVSWSEILSPDFNLLHRPLTILAGLAGAAYEDFSMIFQGRISELGPIRDNSVTLVLRDKGQDLERALSDYVFPESPLVLEEAWGTELDLALGFCRNVTPKLFATGNLYQAPWFPPLNAPPENYRIRWAFSSAVVNQITQMYYQGEALTPPLPPSWIFHQKDLSPAMKNAQGMAELMPYGPYTGGLNLAEWLVVIDSITALNSQGDAGPEIGLATFRWSLDGGVTWQGTGLLTWKLGYDADTLVKSPVNGAAAMAVSGEYTGDCKLFYRVRIADAGADGEFPEEQLVNRDFESPGAGEWYPENAAVIEVNNTEQVYEGDYSARVEAPPGGGNYDGMTQEYVAGAAPGQKFRLKARVYWAWGCAPALCGVNYQSGAYVYDEQRVIGTQPGAWETLVLDYVHNGDDTQFFFEVLGSVVGEAAVFYVDLASLRITDDPPTMEWSDNDGDSWQGPEIIADEEEIDLNRGLRVAFSGEGYDSYVDYWTGAGTGVMTVLERNPGDVCTVTVAAGGGSYTWSGTGGSGGGSIETETPIELWEGYSIEFSDGSYFEGDEGGTTISYVPPFAAGDAWRFGFKEIPIPLADGVSVQFCKGDRTDPAFVLWDEFSFILMSTLNSASIVEDGDIAVDLEGLISPLSQAYVELPGGLAAGLMAAGAGWTAADFDLPALDNFDVAFPYKMGLMVKSGQTIIDAVQQLLTGFPAYYTIRLDGKLYLAELTPPAGDPEFTLTDRDILDFEGQQLAADLVWRVMLHYGRNWTPTQNALPQATAERMAWLRQEWRQVAALDRTILDSYPWAVDQGPLDTSLTEKADAQTLAAKNLAVFGVRREQGRYEVKRPEFFALPLGVLAQVRRGRFGLDDSGLFRLLGQDIDLGGRATVELWR